MKTTIELPDELAAEARDLAREQGSTLRELVVAGLRSEVRRRRGPEVRVDFVFTTVGGRGLRSDVDPARLTDLAYGLPAS